MSNSFITIYSLKRLFDFVKFFIHIYILFLFKKTNPQQQSCGFVFWWAGMDSNHRTRMRTDLQSAAFSHSATYPYYKWTNMFAHTCTLKLNLVRPQGFEPWTHRL